MSNIQMVPEPFVGLRPFLRTTEDQIRFFGRNEDVEEIVSFIVSHRVVLIYGKPVTGKTSIFNAGVIPLLEQYGFDVLPVVKLKTSNIIPISDMNHVKNIYITNSLQSLKPELEPNIIQDKSLSEFLKEYFPLKKDENNNNKPQILIFDQFEEFFEFIISFNWKEQRIDFFKQIAEALLSITSIQIVFIIREGYLAELDSYSDLLPEKFGPRFRLERLRKDDALLAIKNPLQNVPKDFIQNYKGDIDNDINNIIHELMKIQIEDPNGKNYEIEGEFVELISLQIVLRRWWRKISNSNGKPTNQNKFYVSDIDIALEEFYEDIILSTSEKTGILEKEIREWCETKLITSNGTRALIHRDHSSTGGIDNKVVDNLEYSYFIRREWRFGASWYELTDDRFIKAITSCNQKWKNSKKNKIKFGFRK